MKKISLLIGFLMIGNLSAQINTNAKLSVSARTSSFLDASKNTSNYGNNIGKGLNFPQTDLSTFTLNTRVLDGIEYPNYYDGMIVYNTNKGGTTSDQSLTNQTQNLEPGFYYFSNPNGVKTKSIRDGQWVRLGGDLSQSIGSSEGKSPVVVDTKQVYAVKGAFRSNGSTKATLTFPEGIKSIYSIRIYKKDGVAGTKIVHTQLYSYDLTAGAGVDNVVFGSGVMSTSIPEGDYEYVLEYMK